MGLGRVMGRGGGGEGLVSVIEERVILGGSSIFSY